MKTAISVQDNLFKRAERFAHKKKMSRSRLFSEAVEEYLDRRETDDITANLNEVYSTESSAVDPAVIKMAMMSLPKDEW
jgi:metal-responsive CopG/Arc/MetJ family transcriptional regulator